MSTKSACWYAKDGIFHVHIVAVATLSSIIRLVRGAHIADTCMVEAVRDGLLPPNLLPYFFAPSRSFRGRCQLMHLVVDPPKLLGLVRSLERSDNPDVYWLKKCGGVGW